MLRQLLNRARNNLKLNRNLYFGIIAGAVGVIVSLTTVLAVLALTVNASLADRMAEIAAVFGGSAVLLTVVTAGVALRAYAVSPGKPDLKVSIQFPNAQHPNNLTFEVEEQASRYSGIGSGSGSTVLAVKRFSPLKGTIWGRSVAW